MTKWMTLLFAGALIAGLMAGCAPKAEEGEKAPDAAVQTPAAEPPAADPAPAPEGAAAETPAAEPAPAPEGAAAETGETPAAEGGK